MAQKQKSGEFKENREYDQLSEGLGNRGNRGCVIGMSSKMSWKVGFDKYTSSFKKHDRYRLHVTDEVREEVDAALKDGFFKYLEEASNRCREVSYPTTLASCLCHMKVAQRPWQTQKTTIPVHVRAYSRRQGPSTLLMASTSKLLASFTFRSEVCPPDDACSGCYVVS